ncbi:MAG: preprotein translocase subunit SecG [Betaproteobacteria bacterium]|nr:preprotein translocase subunit SecG [Betaproteobacteria bacterium]
MLLVVQVLCALAVIVLVLIQQGKGAEMGAAFGSSGGGASGSLFGATGSANFLSRATAIAATLFFTATLGLAYLGNSAAKSSQLPKSVMEQGPTSQIPGQTGSTPATNPPAAVPNPAANSVPTVTPQAAPSPAVPTVPAGEKTK